MKNRPGEGLSLTLLAGYFRKINPKKKGIWATIRQKIKTLLGGAP